MQQNIFNNCQRFVVKHICRSHQPTLSQNLQKSLPTRPHRPKDKNRMTELIDYYNGMSLDKKEDQLVTRYIKNWADTTEIKGCSSLQTLYRLDSDVLRSAQLFIYRNRYALC